MAGFLEIMKENNAYENACIVVGKIVLIRLINVYELIPMSQ